jgi:hypothetical protein
VTVGVGVGVEAKLVVVVPAPQAGIIDSSITYASDTIRDRLYFLLTGLFLSMSNDQPGEDSRTPGYLILRKDTPECKVIRR